MYTQCAECRTAFKVTAALLQKAGGKVRCSGCGAAFNALEYLSEDPPQTAELTGPRGDHTVRTTALLETLDRLAAPGAMKLEDGALGWRAAEDSDEEEIPELVSSVVAVPNEEHVQGQLFESDPLRHGADLAQMRFDDGTPLPDDFDEHIAESPQESHGGGDAAPGDDAPRAAADHAHAADAAEDTELGATSDWQDLLDEVREDPRDTEAAGEIEMPQTEEAADDAQPAFATEPGGDEEQGDQPTDPVAGGGSDIDVAREADTDESPEEVVAEDPVDPARWFEEQHESVETIILEGDTIVGQREEAAASVADDDDSHTEGLTLQRLRLLGGRRKSDPPGLLVSGGVFLLALLLAAQLVHANRHYLFTFPYFDAAAGPLYRALGTPVTPAWNVRGWQFEATSGATDENDEVLTIVSRIANGFERPLPYPLIQVSLTDRWEEIIGSLILEPANYLPADADPARPVAPSETFTAAISIASPSAEATGFKLNVCYRQAPVELRCATDDFKR